MTSEPVGQSASRIEHLETVERSLYRLLGEIEEANGEASRGTVLEWLVRAAWLEARRDLKAAKEAIEHV